MLKTIVVADSGPLIALARIGHLELAAKLCGQVLVPRAVWEEVTLARTDSPGAMEVARAPWISIREADAALVLPLRLLLDRGEAEAIALAQSLPGAMVMLDDSKARRVAERLGVPRIGTVGMLRQAKQAGLIPFLKPCLEALRANGIFIAQKLVDEALRSVGE